MKNAIRLLGVGLVLTLGCGVTEALDGGTPGDGRWSRMPQAPLSARHAAHAFVVDGILLVIGGTEADPCPPNASCIEPEIAPRRDGAAFDPETNRWRRIADAPVPLGGASGAVVDGTVYLLVWGYGGQAGVRPAFLSYAPETDRWAELALPTSKVELRSLVQFGDDVIAFEGSQERGVHKDLVYDVERDAWSELPVDPLAKTFDRDMVWTGEEVILVGLPHVPQPGSDGPSLYRTAALDVNRKWRRLPTSEVSGHNPEWHFVDGRVVNSSVEKVDGGETNNYGRFYPTGGIFDPVTETWSDLPDPPENDYSAYDELVTGIYVGGEEAVTAGDGWAFHVPSGEWGRLARPEGGPGSEMTAAWVGDRLAIWGGVSWDGSEGRLHDDGWIWEPPW